MVGENDFQESSLSEEELDRIISQGSEEDTKSNNLTDDLLSSLDSKTQSSQGSSLLSDELSDLFSSIQPEETSVSSGYDSLISSNKVSPESGIQKAGIPLNELYDINVRLTVELGRTFLEIKDILLLGEGSIVELDKNVGDEVDILINDRLYARGKLILLDEFYGVQITQILHPAYFKST